MPEIKRPNYFTSQFLVEKDFNDEQAYHLNSRRRHNRQLHTSGVADGLGVTRFSATQVQISAGTAIDSTGREIVLNDVLTYTLATAGNDLDVFLTVAYQEIFDPADHDTQAGLDKFTRTTEHVLVQDGTAVPPTSGAVVVLAKIRLSNTGAIASNSSIDTTVRTLSSAAVAPKAINTAQLADGAVTLLKLATEAQPMPVLGTNAITVNTNTALRQITVGESHSARTDNPHGTTAAQIDSPAGGNQLVTQINAGTGVVTRAHVQSAIISGVVTFQNLAVGMEMFSNDIDPGFGPGVVSVDLAVEDLPAVNLTTSGDTNYARQVQFRSEINRTTGRFRIFVLRNIGSTAGTVAIRWHAFKPVAASDAVVALGVTVTPNSVNLVSGSTQVFTAVIANSTSTPVTWSIPPGSAGTLSNITPTSVTYTPPIISGPYTVQAQSNFDTSKKATAAIVMNADITVTVTSAGNATTVFRGAQLVLTATVINTSSTAVNWSTTGGSLSASSGPTTTFTAPLAPGPYTVTATLASDSNKKGTFNITVPPVTISVSPSQSTLPAGGSTTVFATITGTSDLRATWGVSGSGASVSPGPSGSTTFTGPAGGGNFTVTGTALSDNSKFNTCPITVQTPPKTGDGPPGGGKFVPILEQFAPTIPEAPSGTVAPLEDEQTDTSDKAPPFVRPKKRPSPKLPPKPSDG